MSPEKISIKKQKEFLAQYLKDIKEKILVWIVKFHILII